MQEDIKTTPFLIIRRLAYFAWGMFWIYNIWLSAVFLLANMKTLPLYAEIYVWGLVVYAFVIQWWQVDWKYDLYLWIGLGLLNCYIISLYFPPERYFLFDISFIRNIFY